MFFRAEFVNFLKQLAFVCQKSTGRYDRNLSLPSQIYALFLPQNPSYLMEPLSPSPSPTQKRILVIEDDYANRVFFTDYLRFCQYEVRALTDGQNWQQHLTDFQPHVLLLDLSLPKISGFELIELIRADSTWQTLPIVVVSGYAFDTDRQKAYALGIQAYLVKPVRLRDLAQTIAQVALSGG